LDYLEAQGATPLLFIGVKGKKVGGKFYVKYKETFCIVVGFNYCF